MLTQNIQASPIVQIPRIFESLPYHLNLLGPNYLHSSKQNSGKVFPTAGVMLRRGFQVGTDSGHVFQKFDKEFTA